MRSAVVDRPLDAGAALAEVVRPANGAVVVFVGTVRELNEGREVNGIEYSAYREMAERELADVVREASDRFGTPDVVAEHRIGTLEVGEASVVIAVAHPRRGKAYDASRYVIEELKKRLPIWKREHYTDGRWEWVVAASRKREGDDSGADRDSVPAGEVP